ncbi:MAG: tRNA uridine(34) 5-carboxymethylaminomethyl modification radical SAM/GNAT enzyme Elp3 [Nitrososphaerales archaeon]
MQDLEQERRKLAVSAIARRIQQTEAERGVEINQKELWQIKLDACKEFELASVPKNSDILQQFGADVRSNYVEKLRRKSIRTRSGIAVVTVITKPFDCPHGTCTFCPGGVRFGTPQSYTKNSPASAFGEAREFDPSKQVIDMIEILRKNGHDTSKVELILLGGTILAMPRDYQAEFVKKSYDALNGVPSENLEAAIKQNESAIHRCVGLTIETKPDWCREEHIDQLLSYGTTRVEIGVQSLREDVLKIVNRGHTIQDTIRSFQVSKDSSFKIVAHMMPGLPKSDPDADLEDLVALVNDEDYKPDMLKIYPTIVVEGTALFQQYKMGTFKAYTVEQLVEILTKFKRLVPSWMRIMRIQREIPKAEIAGGARLGNLRQIVLDSMAQKGEACRCIRCREIGHKIPANDLNIEEISLERIDYEASGGHEIFLSFEHSRTDTLLGFLRLRIPSGREHRKEIKDQHCSFVREVHVYGPVVPLGFKTLDPSRPQHHGLGSRLLIEAERISDDEFGRKKQIVISAVGTREYYRKRGYTDDGPFVSKILK